jgi:cell division protein FtsN
MRIDYSEKRTVRESAERKPVPKNRPRKEPAFLFALRSALLLVVIFGAGVLTGWFAFKGTHKAPAANLAQAAKKDEPVPVPAAGTPKPATTPDAQLTFYKTLPAGGKGVIGSGLNLKKTPPASDAHPAPAQATPVAPAAPAADDEKKEAPGRFVVQIASYRDQQEAEKAQARLAGKGVAAYVLESRLKDDTVWYRIRVGRHLTKAEAEELAGKSGKGAVVLAE